MATLCGRLSGVRCNGAAFTSHYRLDPRQLYRLELHFRQGYAFSKSHDAAGSGYPKGVLQRSPASLCFRTGKIILYGTEHVAGQASNKDLTGGRGM